MGMEIREFIFWMIQVLLHNLSVILTSWQRMTLGKKDLGLLLYEWRCLETSACVTLMADCSPKELHKAGKAIEQGGPERSCPPLKWSIPVGTCYTYALWYALAEGFNVQSPKWFGPCLTIFLWDSATVVISQGAWVSSLSYIKWDTAGEVFSVRSLGSGILSWGFQRPFRTCCVSHMFSPGFSWGGGYRAIWQGCRCALSWSLQQDQI